MKKLFTIIGIALAFAIAVFGMTACPGGDNVPNNPKGQVVNQPTSPPAGGNSAPAGGTPPAGEAAPAGGGDSGGEGDEMPSGGD